MPQPLPSDLHVSVPLTNVAVAWKANEGADFVSDKVFPNVPVQKQGDKYWVFHRPDWRRANAQKRAPGTETVGIGWRASTDTYFCDVTGVHKDIDDRERANADSIFRLDKTSTDLVMHDLHLTREKEWVDNHLQTGVWNTEYVGTTDFVKWDNTSSTPIEDMRGYMRAAKRLTGFTPNTLTLTPDVEDTLLDHASILERIKYTQKGVISIDLVASMFKLDRILVVEAVEDASGEEHLDLAADEAAADYQFLASKKALLTYSPSGPALDKPSAGYTFTWAGYVKAAKNGLRVKKFRMEHLNSDRIEGEMSYDQKVVSADCGVLLTDVVA